MWVPSGPRNSAFARDSHHLREHLIDAECGRIDNHGIRCRLHGSDTTLAIAFVTRGYFPKKGREVSTNSFSYQLFKSPLGALFHARREEDFESGIRKNHAAHIPTVRHQARGPAEGPLTGEQRGTHLRISGDA